MELNDLFYSLMFSDTHSLGLLDVVMACLIPFILCFPIVMIYRKTQESLSYTASFLHSIFLFACLSSVVTLIIGGNIARAFGLVGALSIVRFRNALKSPIDTIYIFWALVLGMACGSGYYLAAITFVLVISVFAYALFFFKVGYSKVRSSVIKLSIEKVKEENCLKDVKSTLDKEKIPYSEINRFYDSDSKTITSLLLLELSNKKPLTHVEDLLGKIEGVKQVYFSNSASPAYSVG